MKNKQVLGFKAWILSLEKMDGFIHPQTGYLCEKIKRDKEMPDTFPSKKAFVEYLISKAAHPNAVFMAKEMWDQYERYCQEERARAPDNPWVD